MRAIPLTVKSEIVRKYLLGDSITDISKLCKVGLGTVSAITNEASEKDEYFTVIREVTKTWKKNNLQISDVISGIRLYNMVKKVGLTISFFEDFLEFTNTKSFRLEMDHEKLLEVVEKVLSFEKRFKIKIENIPENQKEVVKALTRFAMEELRFRRIYSKYSVRKSEIEEYLKEKSLFLQYKFDKKNFPSYFDWIIPDDLFEKAFRKKGNKIDKKILYKNLNSIFRDPSNHIEIIEKIMSYSENQQKK